MSLNVGYVLSMCEALDQSPASNDKKDPGMCMEVLTYKVFSLVSNCLMIVKAVRLLLHGRSSMISKSQSKDSMFYPIQGPLNLHSIKYIHIISIVV